MQFFFCFSFHLFAGELFEIGYREISSPLVPRKNLNFSHISKIMGIDTSIRSTVTHKMTFYQKILGIFQQKILIYPALNLPASSRKKIPQSEVPH